MTAIHVNTSITCLAKSLPDDDELIGELLWAPAMEVAGSGLDDQQLLQAVAESFDGQPVCIVRHWMLIDVMFTDRRDSLIRQQDLQPLVLYANTTVGTGAPTDHATHVLSGFALRFADFFFETEDMLYVLAGRGFRKQSGMEAVAALDRHCGRAFSLPDPAGSCSWTRLLWLAR